VRGQVPTLEEDRYLHTDLMAATELVQSGAVVKAAAAIELPGVTETA
jgi:histidine ammonia-lyase